MIFRTAVFETRTYSGHAFVKTSADKCERRTSSLTGGEAAYSIGSCNYFE